MSVGCEHKLVYRKLVIITHDIPRHKLNKALEPLDEGTYEEYHTIVRCETCDALIDEMEVE